MTLRRWIAFRRTRVCSLSVFFLIIVAAAPILALPQGMQDDKYEGWRWFREEPPEISKNEEYIVGVTPYYYSSRYQGSFNKFTSGETSFTHQCLWKDRVGTPAEVLEVDAMMRADFKAPPGILVPEDTIYLPASVSGSGFSPNTLIFIQFEYRTEGVTLHGGTQANTGSAANPPFKKVSINPYFIVPIPNEHSGKIQITAFLWNDPCYVTWTYKARQVSPTSVQERGTVIEPRGAVEHYVKAFNKWVGPLRADTPVYTGDIVRTGPNSSCRVVFRNRAGRQDTITVGPDTLLEIPEIPELQPRLSITTQIWKGIIKIKKAILREPPTEEERLEEIFTVRTPTIVVGVRGTEFILSVRENESSEILLKEGQLEITNLKTNLRTILPAGKQMIVRDDGSEERGVIAAGQWNSYIASYFPDESGRIAGYDIPLLKAEVTGLRFFESGYDPPDKNQRTYPTEFVNLSSRYINWELNLEFPAPGRRIDFDILAVWYNPDGSVMARQTKASYIESDWTNSYHSYGRGWKEPGNWIPGTYRVDLLVGDHKIASGSFTVIQ
jgi:hypothetical protein